MNQNIFIIYISLIIGVYLYSSIPFALLIGKIYGIDIRNEGSKNIGGSNLGRTCGAHTFILAFILDMSKGIFAVLLANYFNLNPLFIFPFAIIGHTFSCFIHFKGGKGVATAFGFALAYSFIPAIIAIISFLIFLYTWKYVSLASILAIFIFSIVGFITHNYILGFFVLLMNILVIYLHRNNIKNIKNGTERKITWM